MEEAGIEVRPHWVMIDSSMTSNFQNPIDEPTLLATRYLAVAKEVDAVVGATDYIGYGLVAAARNAAIDVPRELKIGGIDGYYTPGTPDTPRITTYQSPCVQSGRIAFEMLEKTIRGELPLTEERLLRGEVIPGYSTVKDSKPSTRRKLQTR